jgi:trehalose-6-phosphate synthase
MRALRHRVLTHDVERWSKDFLGALAQLRPTESAKAAAAAE